MKLIDEAAKHLSPDGQDQTGGIAKISGSRRLEHRGLDNIFITPFQTKNDISEALNSSNPTLSARHARQTVATFFVAKLHPSRK